MILIILKLALLIVGIAYGFTCFARLVFKQNIHTGQILLMSIGIVGFLAIQFNWINI